MIDLLAQSLKDLRPGIVPAGFQREIREHARIPDPAANALTEKRLIANIKTIAGGTNKGAYPAAQAGGCGFLPEIADVKKIL